MLKRLRIENFKSWREADIRFGTITGLFGANSSGKSSLLQFLLLLRQTRESTDRAAALALNGRFARLGAAVDVIRDHDEERDLRFRLDFDHDADFGVMDPDSGATLARSPNLAVRARLEIREGAFRSRSLAYSVGDACFRLRRNGPEGFDLAAETPGSNFSFDRRPGRPWSLPDPIGTWRFPDRARTGFYNSGFLVDLETAFEDLLDRLHYLGPLRIPPERDYFWARSRPADLGAAGERSIDAILAAQGAHERQNLEKHGRLMRFDEIVARRLKDMGLVETFRVEEIAAGSNRWQVKARTLERGAEVVLADTGFGVSQALPVVVLLHYAPKGSIVLLEQPEIHLHPLAQAELADAIIGAAIHRNLQVVFESHSEHLLLRLQRRIAEVKREIEADAVSLFFCKTCGGESRIEPLELDALGNIRNWPEKFMGDAFGETAEAELERLKRRRKAAE